MDVSTALVGGGDLIVGEDGSGDADGYWLDLDAVTGSLKANGALLMTAPATANEIGNEKSHKVAAAKDGVLITIGTTAYTEGVLNFTFIGYQGE